MRLHTRISLLLLLAGLGFSCQPADTEFTSEGVVVAAPM